MAERLTNNSIKKLIEKSVKGDHRDAGAPGLMLRIWGEGKWTWNLRRTFQGKDYRLDLGNVWTLDEAREIAGVADQTIKLGANPFYTRFDETPAFLQHFVDRKLGPKAPPPPPPRPAPEPEKPKSIVWEAAVEQYLAYLLEKRREDTERSYKSCLRISEMKRFEGRMVRDISLQDAAEAVLEIHQRAERQAETTTTAIRRLFWFLGDPSRNRLTGVETDRMKSLKAPERSNAETRKKKAETNGTKQKKDSKYLPSVEELAAIMLDMRNLDSEIPQRERLAVELLIYSAQRRRMVASARCDDFELLDDGSVLWRIPPLHRKTAEMRERSGAEVGDHVVPLPPSVGCVVRRAINLAAGRKHLFPPRKNRRANKRSYHMAGDSLTHLLAECGYKPTPHDVRRALGTSYLVHHCGLTRKAAKPIAKEVLDHAEGDDPDVTTKHYVLDSDLNVKWKTMKGWCQWIDDAIRTASTPQSQETSSGS